MIGETIKIGFDGQQVTKGLGGIMGGFRKLRSGIGSVMKETGRGAALSLGNSLFNAVSNLALAIPNELKSLAELNKELEVMNITTGILPEKYLALRDAMSKATGKGLEDSGDDLKDFVERIDEARRDWDSSPAVGMRRLGIFSMDLKDKGIDEQLKVIGQKVKDFESKNGPGKSIFPLREAFGDQAANWLPLLMDIEGYMERAEKSTAGFAEQMKEAKESLQSINTIRSALGQKMSELSVGFLQGLQAAGLEVKDISEFISNLKLGEGMSELASFIKNIMSSIQDKGLFGFITDSITSALSGLATMAKNLLFAALDGILEWAKTRLGDAAKWISDVIAEGIRNGISTAIEGMKDVKTIFNMFKAGFSGDRKKVNEEYQKGREAGGLFNTTKTTMMNQSENPIMKMIADNTERTTRLLERIGMKNTSTSTFA